MLPPKLPPKSRPKPTPTNEVQRKVKVVVEQHIMCVCHCITVMPRTVLCLTNMNLCSNKPPVENFPMREWSMKIYLVDQDGTEKPADVFTKVVYNLHPTFENPVQSRFTLHPFGPDQ
jgi:transcription initiation factor TFIID/TFIIF subunit